MRRRTAYNRRRRRSSSSFSCFLGKGRLVRATLCTPRTATKKYSRRETYVNVYINTSPARPLVHGMKASAFWGKQCKAVLL